MTDYVTVSEPEKGINRIIMEFKFSSKGGNVEYGILN